MGTYKDNFEEQHERRKYKKSENLLTLFLASLLSWISLSFFFMPDSDALFYFMNVDTVNSGFYWLSGGILLVVIRWWWWGTPFLIKKIFAPLVSLLPEVIRVGKRETLEAFFYQGIITTDGVKRARDYRYLSSSKYSIDNMFDYDPVMGKADKEKTKRIIMLFRDKKREKIFKLISSKDEKISKKAKKALLAYNEEYATRISPDQDFIYDDLWRAIEGILQSYEVVIDGEIASRLEVANLHSPIKLKYSEQQRIMLLDSVDESIDVFQDGQVLFSIDMIIETVEKITLLFYNHIKRNVETGSEIRSRFNKFMEDEGAYIQKVTDYFMFVFFRRLLLNYGAMPSGWFVGRIEDYDIRAIVSAVDRELIPTITTQNDGSNNIYGDDSFAAMFLFIYWDFVKGDIIREVLEAVDWCFNTTKDVNEMKMRDFARNSKNAEDSSNDDPFWSEL